MVIKLNGVIFHAIFLGYVTFLGRVLRAIPYLSAFSQVVLVLLLCMGCPLGWASQVPFGPGLNIDGLFYGRQNNIDPVALFSKLRATGFVWVRLPIDVTLLMQKDSTAVHDIESRLPMLLEVAEGQSLSVVVAPVFQPRSGSNVSILGEVNTFQVYQKVLEKIAYFVNNYKMAKLELLNEPDSCQNGNGWADEQAVLYTRIRSLYPNLALILTSDCWSKQNSFLNFDPNPYVGDENAFFTFHFYDPIIFTSQNMPWSHDFPRFTKGIRFPPVSSELDKVESDVEMAIENAQDFNHKEKNRMLWNFHSSVRTYRVTNWKVEIFEVFQQVRMWGKLHQISASRIILGEFGVARSEQGTSRADETSRLDWTRIVVEAAKMNGLPWAYYSLSDSFGIMIQASPLQFNQQLVAIIIN